MMNGWKVRRTRRSSCRQQIMVGVRLVFHNYSRAQGTLPNFIIRTNKKWSVRTLYQAFSTGALCESKECIYTGFQSSLNCLKSSSSLLSAPSPLSGRFIVR